MEKIGGRRQSCPPDDNMYRKVKEYAEKNRMIEEGDAVVAGVSGGGDSMAMLYFLRDYQKEKKFLLCVVHVNHGIRGEEAERDQKMVEETCRILEIPCRVCRFDVPGIAAERKTGLEETGRMLRKEAFLSAAREFRDKGMRVRIAVAHNRNDLAETMLHHLARGTGLRGLGGMDAVSGETIRPLLCLERKEIDNYLIERKIPHAVDSTNFLDAYTRNRIRRHILPALEREVNAKTVAHLAEASLLFRRADAYLTKTAQEILKSCEREEGGYFFGEDFFALDPVLKSYGILEAIGVLAGKRKDLSSAHVDEVLELYEKQSGRRIRLPCGITARRETDGIVLERGDRPEKITGEWELPLPGELVCPLGTFRAKIFPYEGQTISEKKYTKWFDYDKIQKSVVIRTRKSGDYLVIDREGNHKKLKKFMIDEKVPARRRDQLALAACGAEILWIAGGRMNENYKITFQTRRVLELQYEEAEPVRHL